MCVAGSMPEAVGADTAATAQSVHAERCEVHALAFR